MRGHEAGFTLMEVLVALALFALIGVAGATLVDSVLDIHRRTQGRLDRVADLQRAMFILDADLTQLAPGPIVVNKRGFAFTRHAPRGADETIAYGLRGDGITRRVGARDQALLGGVTGVRWSFFQPGRGWRDQWPPSGARADAWPAAIAIDLQLAPGLEPSGTVRRVVALPAQP